MTNTLDLKTFLDGNDLTEYAAAWLKDGYEVRDLLESSEEELRELVGGKIAHLKRLQRGLAKLAPMLHPLVIQ